MRRVSAPEPPFSSGQVPGPGTGMMSPRGKHANGYHSDDHAPYTQLELKNDAVKVKGMALHIATSGFWPGLVKQGLRVWSCRIGALGFGSANLIFRSQGFAYLNNDAPSHKELLQGLPVAIGALGLCIPHPFTSLHTMHAWSAAYLPNVACKQMRKHEHFCPLPCTM